MRLQITLRQLKIIGGRKMRPPDMDDFIDFIITEGKEHQKFLNERVKIAENTNLTKDFLDFFINKFLIAYATKDKIKDQFTILSEKFGRTTWALSSRLRYVGTKDIYTQQATRWLLIETGTIAIEDNFRDYIQTVKSIELKEIMIYFENLPCQHSSKPKFKFCLINPF